MAKFKFPLQAVLKVREQTEQAAQRVLAGHRREQVRLEEMLRTQQQRLTDSSAELRGKLVGELNVNDLRLHAASAVAGARDAHRLLLELAHVHRQVDAARNELIAARQGRMAMERLRERRFQAWQARLTNAENELLDDIACRPRRASRAGCPEVKS